MPPPPSPSSSGSPPSLGWTETASLESCTTRIIKTYPNPPQLYDPSNCFAGILLFVGSSGSAMMCTRGFHIFLMHFKLPDGLASGQIEQASLSVYIQQEVEGGVQVRLDGLGIRSGDLAEALASQSADDWYVGQADDTQGVTEITPSMIPQQSGRETWFNFTSATLTQYVQDQLGSGGAGKHIVLRISTSDDYGCAEACNFDCKKRRYQLIA
eukprot:scaffold323876_cov68-Tisochrysis_lutea.AAC.1